MGGRLQIGMADITSERVADFIPESLADLLRNQHMRIPTMSAGRSDLMSATCSDRSRPAVPIDVGRGGASPAGRL
jgi:hypothetical protein